MVTAALELSLPWYFGVAVFAIWGALIVALVAMVRYRLRARAQRRALARRTGSDPIVLPDDRSIGPGTDLEIW